MLFDPAVLWQAPDELAVTVGIILVGKALATVSLVLLLRYPLNTALTVGVSLGLLHKEGQDLILAAALVSLAANSVLFRAMSPLLVWARAHSALVRRLEARDDPLAQLPVTVDQTHLSGQVVIVGHGAIGQQPACTTHPCGRSRREPRHRRGPG
jgi:CPA2 family monovalent cation:H+ antiporter-2